ncbi:MAG: type II transport protein GspH [Pseudomonadales bacterium]|nr:type II transport protein GspH [Pseudomonadales bacterium]
MKKLISGFIYSRICATQQRGFTLLELMVVVGIAAILMSIAAPNMQTIIQNGRLVAQFNESVGLLSFVRSEAIKRKAFTITLCGSDDAYKAIPTCNSSSWEKGWMIFSDSDNDRKLEPALGEELIRIGAPIEGGNTLRSQGFDASSYITFDKYGQPTAAGTLIVCDDRGTKKAKAVVISAAGQTRKAVDETSSRVVNNHSGDDISCP